VEGFNVGKVLAVVSVLLKGHSKVPAFLGEVMVGRVLENKLALCNIVAHIPLVKKSEKVQTTSSECLSDTSAKKEASSGWNVAICANYTQKDSLNTSVVHLS